MTPLKSSNFDHGSFDSNHNSNAEVITPQKTQAVPAFPGQEEGVGASPYQLMKRNIQQQQLQKTEPYRHPGEATEYRLVP